MTNIVKRNPSESTLSRLSPQQPLRSHEWDEALSVRRLVGRLLGKKHVVLVTMVMVLVPAAIATYLMTPLYRSAAMVQLNPDPVQVLPYRDVADGAVGGAGFDNFMGSQEQLLKGPGLRSRVAQRLQTDLKDDPAAAEASKLADRFSVKKIEKSQLFELAYLGESPRAAATVVNLYAEEFVKQNFELRQETRIKAEQDLKKELEGLEKRLQLSEKELMAYAQRNDIMSLEQGQVDPLQQRLTVLTQQLAEAEGQVASARSSLDTIQKASVADFPPRLVTQSIASLEGRVLQLEQDLTTLRSTFGENWPAVVEKRNEIKLVREQLGREKSAVLASHQEQARLDLQGAEARRSMAVGSLDEQKGLVNQFHDASIQYNILKREVDTNRNLYEGLLQRLRQTGVMAGFQFGNIQLVEPGKPSNLVDSPKVLWNLGIALLLGLAMGVCFVILLDFWDNSISTLEEVEQLAPLASLGSVPLMKTFKSSGLLPHSNGNGHGNGNGNGKISVPVLTQRMSPPSVFAGQASTLPFEVTESIRAICASILLSRSDERPRVIVVTSATHAEGKTTLVTHLGRAFAEAGHSTLLVEADMRKPDLSKAFSIGNEDGLSLYLAGHVSPWPKVHETETHNLFVAAAGPMPPNPAALLHSEKLKLFLKAAASDYQVVIVDAPPLLSIADARILGLAADGVVLVVRAGKTGKNLVRRACALLETSGANVLGMVLNGWAPSAAELSHYRYHHHHHHGQNAHS